MTPETNAAGAGLVLPRAALEPQQAIGWAGSSAHDLSQFLPCRWLLSSG